LTAFKTSGVSSALLLVVLLLRVDCA